MRSDPTTFAALLDWCADLTGAFLRAQVLAGASVVQLFDSWAGSLSRADYERSVLPHSRRALDAVADLGVPRIHFGLGTGEFIDLLPLAGADVVGVDWRLPLDEASVRLGGRVPLQGNIDPALLAAPPEVLDAHVADVLRRGDAAPAHIVNLGHGVPPDADPGVLTRLVDVVHAAPEAAGAAA
jgi:uroporphyrinogen decarboxylase